MCFRSKDDARPSVPGTTTYDLYHFLFGRVKGLQAFPQKKQNIFRKRTCHLQKRAILLLYKLKGFTIKDSYSKIKRIQFYGQPESAASKGAEK